MKNYIQTIKDYIKEFRELWSEADEVVHRVFIIRSAAAIIGLGSFVLFGVTVSWWAAVCLFLILTANNIEQRFK